MKTIAKDETAKTTSSRGKFLFNGITIGSISLFISFLGASVTFPFIQAQRDKLGCDALCYGSMQSARSGLGMIGTVLIGRLSDTMSRSTVLHVGTLSSLFSYSVNYYGKDISSLWLSLIPSSLLNQNYGVMKALFADYSQQYGYSEVERASAVGQLGMVAGVSFMLGPIIGTQLLGSYEQATFAAIISTILSGLLLIFLPGTNVIKSTRSTANAVADTNDEQFTTNKKYDDERVPIQPKKSPKSLFYPFIKMKEAVIGFLYMPALQTPGTRLLLSIRFFMALSFHIFVIVWTVSLKSRFSFGPQDHAYFMGWIGLCYSISQGFLAKFFISMTGEDHTRLLQLCVMLLSLGRVAALMTKSMLMVYIIMAGVIVALGIMNTAMTSACSRLAGKDQIGGLYGIFEAMENLAGLIGPALAGILQRLNPHLPIVSVVGLYAIVFLAVTLYYRKFVLHNSAESRNLSIKKVTSDGNLDGESISAKSPASVADFSCIGTDDNVQEEFYNLRKTTIKKLR